MDDWVPLNPPPRVVGLEARDSKDLLLEMVRFKPEEGLLDEAVLGHEWFTSNYSGEDERKPGLYQSSIL